jgi:hypothetical protein
MLPADRLSSTYSSGSLQARTVYIRGDAAHTAQTHSKRCDEIPQGRLRTPPKHAALEHQSPSSMCQVATVCAGKSPLGRFRKYRRIRSLPVAARNPISVGGRCPEGKPATRSPALLATYTLEPLYRNCENALVLHMSFVVMTRSESGRRGYPMTRSRFGDLRLWLKLTLAPEWKE